MTPRDRFVRHMTGQSVDRPPYWLIWGPWSTTWQRWKREGGMEDGFNIREHFGSDPLPQTLRVNLGPCPRLQRKVVAEDADFVTFIDSWGILRKDYKHGVSMSQFLKFPVADRADWERFKAEHLDPDHPERLAGDWMKMAEQWSAEGKPIQLGYYPDCTVFGGVRWLLGDEECLMAFYTMPELVHEIMERLTDIFITVFEKVVEHVRVDVIHIWEDMCGRNGPLIGPEMWERFMGPCYRRIQRFAADHGIPLISVDTDGDCNLIIPPMMRNGVNYVFPFEVAAGCDVNEYQKRYPTLAMSGGIDKRILAQGPAAIDRELERIRPAVDRGRYIPELDHLVPDDVSWENYGHYARGLRKLIGKP